MSAKDTTKRRQLMGHMLAEGDAHVAIQARSQHEASNAQCRGENRIEWLYPLEKLRPSPNNRRLVDFERAGVTPERLEQLRRVRLETADAWHERLDAFLQTIEDDQFAHKVWLDLFELAMSLVLGQLSQPIQARPDGVIIAGFRRCTALKLAGHDKGPVTVIELDEKQEEHFRFTENTHRSDLSFVANCLAVRDRVASMSGAPCGPNNPKTTIADMMDYLGVKKSQAACYRALCLLPENDPHMDKLRASGYADLNALYEEVGPYVKTLKNFDVEAAATIKEAVTQEVASLAAKPPAKRKAPSVPKVSVELPSSSRAGTKFFEVFAGLDALSDKTKGVIAEAMNDYLTAPEKMQQKIFNKVLSSVLEEFNRAYEEDANDSA